MSIANIPDHENDAKVMVDLACNLINANLKSILKMKNKNLQILKLEKLKKEIDEQVKDLADVLRQIEDKQKGGF